RLPSVLPVPQGAYHRRGLSPSVSACLPCQHQTLSPRQGDRRRPKSGGGLGQYLRRPDEPAGTRPGSSAGAVRRAGNPETVVRGRGEQQSKSTLALEEFRALEGTSPSELHKEASYYYLCRTAGPGVLKTPFTASAPLRRRRDSASGGESRTALPFAGSASALSRRLERPQRVGRSPTASGWSDGLDRDLRLNAIPAAPPVAASYLWRRVTTSQSLANRSLQEEAPEAANGNSSVGNLLTGPSARRI
ncbi:hypothetical protein FOZ63_005011, partial [Perkinsus olseni]